MILLVKLFNESFTSTVWTHGGGKQQGIYMGTLI